MKPIELREADFKRELKAFSYSNEMKQEFSDYWTEPDRAANPKMRYEKEKTWHLGRRLARWARSGKEEIKTVHKMKPFPVPELTTPEEKLDSFIDQYRQHPSEIPFQKFGQWYDWMKEKKLLKPFYPGEVDQLKELYNNDNYKCRCACVQLSLLEWVNSGLRVQDLLKMRKNLTT